MFMICFRMIGDWWQMFIYTYTVYAVLTARLPTWRIHFWLVNNVLKDLQSKVFEAQTGSGLDGKIGIC